MRDTQLGKGYRSASKEMKAMVIFFKKYVWLIDCWCMLHFSMATIKWKSDSKSLTSYIANTAEIKHRRRSWGKNKRMSNRHIILRWYGGPQAHHDRQWSVCLLPFQKGAVSKATKYTTRRFQSSTNKHKVDWVKSYKTKSNGTKQR